MLIVLDTKAGIVFYYVLYFVLGCCIVASLFGWLGLVPGYFGVGMLFVLLLV